MTGRPKQAVEIHIRMSRQISFYSSLLFITEFLFNDTSSICDSYAYVN